MNVAKSATNYSDKARQGQIKTQLKKLNYCYYRKIVSAPPSINLRIDSGATHCLHKIGSTNLPQQPTYNYNPAAQVIVTNR